jgi:hypothetical protein
MNKLRVCTAISSRDLDKMKLKRFMLSLTNFDHQRLVFHAARQTLRKAEMARLALHGWLNQHDSELEKWKNKKADEIGISVSELEQQLLNNTHYHPIKNKEDEELNQEVNPGDGDLVQESP